MGPKLLRCVAVVALGLVGAACSSSTPNSCGHDLSGQHSTVVALDPATGDEVWRVEIPLARWEDLHLEDGELRVRLEGQQREARFDADSGDYLGTVDANTSVVDADVTGSAVPRLATADTGGPPESSAISPTSDVDSDRPSGSSGLDGIATSPAALLGSVDVERVWEVSSGQSAIRGRVSGGQTVLWRFEPDRPYVSGPVTTGGRAVVVTYDFIPFCP